MLFFLFAFVIGGIVYATTRRISESLSLFLLNWFMFWAILPIFQFNFLGLPAILVINGLVMVFWEYVASENYSSELKKGGLIASLVFTGIALLWGGIIPFITSSGMMHADSYRSLIGEIEEGVFSTDTTSVDITQVRKVDQALATRLADKRLGEDAALGSQVDVGTMNIQLVNNRLYWVGALDHSGFFKWYINTQGTPGYIMVSATDERDIKLVQEIHGKKIFLKYNGNCYWGDSLRRYMYNHGYRTKGLTDYTFEIDEEGNPFWVITRYEKKVGFMGNDPIGVVVLNAQNGEIKEYGIDDAPSWIDRIQPEDIVTAQLNDWGEYVHGWFNPSDDDRLKVTEGMSLVYGEDGRSYWYTGITSVGSDEGTVGFVLVDTRNKKAKLYRQAGATETAARGSAEGAVQEKGYQATFPILYNISGAPTYFTTLKDDAGLVKLMAWISVEDYNVVGIGSTVNEALRNYRRSFMSKGNDIAPDTDVSRQTIEGKVVRIGKEGDNYYFLIGGGEEKLFVGSIDLSAEIVVTAVGDLVKIKYDDGGSEVVDMVDFDNTEINLQKTEEQLEVDDQAEAVRERKYEKRMDQNADAAWEELTPEEKNEILKKQK